MRVIEAQYEGGVLRQAEHLCLRPGERLKLIVVRNADPSRWDLARLAKSAIGDDLALAELGLPEWAGELDATERTEARRVMVGRPRCVSAPRIDRSQACRNLAE